MSARAPQEILPRRGDGTATPPGMVGRDGTDIASWWVEAEAAVELETRQKLGAAIWSVGLLTLLGWVLLVHNESNGVGYGFPPVQSQMALDETGDPSDAVAIVREH